MTGAIFYMIQVFTFISSFPPNNTFYKKKIVFIQEFWI